MPKIRKTKITAKTQQEWKFALAIFDMKMYDKLVNDPMVTFLISGDEICPKTQNFHKQVYFEYKKSRLSTLFNRYPKLSFRDKNGRLLIARGDLASQYRYCHKDKTNVHTQGTPRSETKSENPHWCPDITLRPWQINLKNLVLDAPMDRKLYWIWSQAGNTGKSTFAKWIVYNYYPDAIVVNGKSSDMQYAIIRHKEKHGTWPKICVMNIPKCIDSQYISFTGIETCKDMLFNSGKYEGGQVSQEGTKMIIFSNSHPNYENASRDRWCEYEIPNPKNYNLTEINKLEWGRVIAPTQSQIPAPGKGI